VRIGKLQNPVGKVNAVGNAGAELLIRLVCVLRMYQHTSKKMSVFTFLRSPSNLSWTALELYYARNFP